MRVVILILLITAAGMASAGSATANQYETAKGRQLWEKDNRHENQPTLRRCGDCHGEDLVNSGKHVKTGKVIDPMAASVNKERYQDPKKIEKWFLRNCKWTYGRECSADEKGHLLKYLMSL